MSNRLQNKRNAGNENLRARKFKRPKKQQTTARVFRSKTNPRKFKRENRRIRIMSRKGPLLRKPCMTNGHQTFWAFRRRQPRRHRVRLGQPGTPTQLMLMHRISWRKASLRPPVVGSCNLRDQWSYLWWLSVRNMSFAGAAVRNVSFAGAAVRKMSCAGAAVLI